MSALTVEREFPLLVSALRRKVSPEANRVRNLILKGIPAERLERLVDPTSEDVCTPGEGSAVLPILSRAPPGEQPGADAAITSKFVSDVWHTRDEDGLADYSVDGSSSGSKAPA